MHITPHTEVTKAQMSVTQRRNTLELAQVRLRQAEDRLAEVKAEVKANLTAEAEVTRR